MQVTLWGTRGSLATPGPEMARYGGNTSCVGVVGREGTLLVLDAGTGIRPLAATIPESMRRVDILLTHLHMDHIQGLGFFAPLYRPDVEVHIWGPGSATLRLQARLIRYLSPPLFPVSLSELPCKLTLHEVPFDDADIGESRVTSALVCHPGPTVGYRIADADEAVAAGLTHWRLHLLVLALTFGLFPLMGLGLAALPAVLTPPAMASSDWPVRRLWQARWIATSEEEQAVSMVNDGPRKSRK
jgi:ribonuclease BN (tRNA processing enzyme)